MIKSVSQESIKAAEDYFNAVEKGELERVSKSISQGSEDEPHEEFKVEEEVNDNNGENQDIDKEEGDIINKETVEQDNELGAEEGGIEEQEKDNTEEFPNEEQAKEEEPKENEGQPDGSAQENEEEQQEDYEEQNVGDDTEKPSNVEEENNEEPEESQNLDSNVLDQPESKDEIEAQ